MNLCIRMSQANDCNGYARPDPCSEELITHWCYKNLQYFDSIYSRLLNEGQNLTFFIEARPAVYTSEKRAFAVATKWKIFLSSGGKTVIPLPHGDLKWQVISNHTRYYRCQVDYYCASKVSKYFLHKPHVNRL